MEDQDFQQKWKQANETDRLRFVAALVPLANNGGVGRSKRAARYILENQDGKNLGGLASDLQKSLLLPTASRGAKRGLESMNALLKLIP
jgi:hypothetical protein